MTGSLTGRPAAGATGCLPGWGDRDRFPLRDRQVAPLRRIRDAQVPVTLIIASANRLPWARRLATAAGRSLLSGGRRSTRLNSSHLGISYAVFCLIKKPE